MKFPVLFLAFVLLTDSANADTPLINLFLPQDDGEWRELLDSSNIETRVESCRPEDTSTMRGLADDSTILAAFNEYQESIVAVNLVSLTLVRIFQNEPNLVSAFESHINGYDDVYREPLTRENSAIDAASCDDLPDLLASSAETRLAFSRHMFQFVQVYADARGIENWRTILSE